ncbi:MAG: hypothetical protein OXI90_07205 [Gammaproteobacteria bacterium]|nr:hypothetical protein [Gammaproteobacteria bacterium]
MLRISDPWDLGESLSWQPYRASVLAGDKRRVLIRLDEPFVYEGKQREYFLAASRHAGHPATDLAKGRSIFSNLDQIESDAIDFADLLNEERWRGGTGIGLIGTLDPILGSSKCSRPLRPARNLGMTAFESAACDVFRYLIDDFGYQMTKRSQGLITYCGNGVFVTISHDFNGSCELALFLGQEDELPSFGLGKALRSCNAPAELPYSYQAIDVAKLRKDAGELADSLRLYCSELLVGDWQAFQKLAELHEVECNAFERERRLRSAREAANQAWSTGGYQQVIDAFAPHEDFLRKSERMKLAYARKRLRGK